MGRGDPVDSGPQEDKVLGLTLIPGPPESVDTYASSQLGHGFWAEISGAVQGANNTNPRLDVLLRKGGEI